MSRKKIIYIGLLIIVVMSISYFYNNFLTKQMIVGRYVNRNYNHSFTFGDIPYKEDTLILFDDNKYASIHWGKGTYRLLYSLRNGTEVELEYKYEFGMAGYITRIKRLNYGNPIMLLDEDQNHYYEKIE